MENKKDVIELFAKFIEIISNNGNHNKGNSHFCSDVLKRNTNNVFIGPHPEDAITSIMDYFVKTERINANEAYDMIRKPWRNISSYVSLAVVILDMMVKMKKMTSEGALSALREIVDMEFSNKLTYDNIVNILIKAKIIRNREAALIYYNNINSPFENIKELDGDK
ncbi:MAG: hypothetical protein ACUVWP_01280 [bacterium]